MGKKFSVTVAGRQFETRAWHKVGSALTNYYRSEGFKNSYDSKKYTSPIEVVLTEDRPQALYCHLLCGLLQHSQVWCLEAGFAFNMDAAFTMLRTSWQLGDVVRMMGFNGGSPEFEFVQRNNVLLSANSDKTDEGELQNVMEKASTFVKGEGGVQSLCQSLLQLWTLCYICGS
ncbi:hypothetical protein SUGI_0817090 [Cryptomeria japonica]|nr:hypothetical protein SUGI_0817090 [Cryptomeria japonica]